MKLIRYFINSLVGSLVGMWVIILIGTLTVGQFIELDWNHPHFCYFYICYGISFVIMFFGQLFYKGNKS